MSLIFIVQQFRNRNKNIISQLKILGKIICMVGINLYKYFNVVRFSTYVSMNCVDFDTIANRFLYERILYRTCNVKQTKMSTKNV